MKKGWKEITLKEVANYRRGSFPQPYGNPEWYDGEESMPFVQVAELQEDSFSLIMPTKKKISKIAQPLSIFVPKGTVLVSLQGSIGKVGITEDDCYVDRTIAIFQSFKIPVEINFFAYQLKIRFSIERLKARGTTIKTITKEEFANFTVMLPPLSEQKEIVEYLDSSFAKIDKLKENAAKNLEEAKALFQSALKDALEPKEGWEEKMLKELTNKISDGSHNPPTGLSYSKYRMLSSKNVRNDNFSFDNPRYLSEDDFQKENKRTQLEKGDVLLTIVGAGLGDCCVYNFDDVIVFQRSVSVLKPNYDKITSRFLMYSLQFRYDDIRKKSNGAAQKGIYLKQLAAYSLKLPSIKEQQSIVSHLDSLNEKVNTLQQNYSRICDECDALKQAILRQVFE